jgi:hypothetical protein
MPVPLRPNRESRTVRSPPAFVPEKPIAESRAVTPTSVVRHGEQAPM